MTFPPVNACTEECGEGTFTRTQDNQKYCQLCNPLCETCSNANTCSTCKAQQSVVSFSDQKLCMCDKQVSISADSTYLEFTFNFPTGMRLNLPLITSGFYPEEPSLQGVFESYKQVGNVWDEINDYDP